MSGAASPKPAPRRPERLLDRGRPRRLPSAGAILRRRRIVGFAKRVLPLIALALLGLVAVWPEIADQADRARLVYRRSTLAPEAGVLTKARYRGEDEDHQPYTLTAEVARQVGADRIDLTGPVGDIVLNSGTWLEVEAARGTYMQKSAQLDLSGDVTLYRDDGTLLTTDSATADLRQGVVASGARTHVEGPFGTLDAQGFTITEGGHVARFTGPARLVLRGAGS